MTGQGKLAPPTVVSVGSDNVTVGLESSVVDAPFFAGTTGESSDGPCGGRQERPVDWLQDLSISPAFSDCTSIPKDLGLHLKTGTEYTKVFSLPIGELTMGEHSEYPLRAN